VNRRATVKVSKGKNLPKRGHCREIGAPRGNAAKRGARTPLGDLSPQRLPRSIPLVNQKCTPPRLCWFSKRAQNTFVGN
jgi:hypothetical protein